VGYWGVGRQCKQPNGCLHHYFLESDVDQKDGYELVKGFSWGALEGTCDNSYCHILHSLQGLHVPFLVAEPHWGPICQDWHTNCIVCQVSAGVVQASHRVSQQLKGFEGALSPGGDCCNVFVPC
jgi:hypothetical protein